MSYTSADSNNEFLPTTYAAGLAAALFPMKRCPECRRDYYDDSLLYCLDDGSQLLEGPRLSIGADTAVMRGSGALDGDQLQQTERPDMAASVPVADDLYYQAKFYSSRDNRADNEKAIELLENAVDLDPEHAPSHIELARAYGIRAFYFDSDNKDLLAKGYALLQRAFRLGTHVAEAHEVKGFLLWSPANGFPHEQAIAEYRVALSQDPQLVDAHHWLAAVYFHIGLLQEADAEIQTTLQLDPGKNVARLHAAMVHSYAGRYKEAVQALRALPVDLNPPLVASTTSWCLLNLGRLDAASDLLERTLVQYPADIGGQFAGLRAMILATTGDSSAAETAIAEAIDKGSGFGHFHHTTHFIAAAYALMGRPHDSVEYLHLTADNGFPCYPLFNNDPNFSNIRADAAFQDFITEQREIWEDRVAKYGASAADLAATALFRRQI